MMKPARAATLNAFDATMLVMGGIIGVGIFFSPNGVATHAPDDATFVAMWIAGAVVAMCGAFTFAEWGASFPRAGGWFVFLRQTFPPVVAFVFAWVVLGVISTGALAIIASFAADNARVFLPWIGEAGTVSHRNAAGALILALTALTLCGVKAGATFQNLCMIAKLVAILALIAGAFAFFVPGEGMPPRAGTQTGNAEGSIATAALSVFFAYGGWQHLCYIAPNIKDPARTLPRAIVFGVLGVGIVYVATNLGYLRVLGIDGLIAHRNVGAAAAEASLGGGMVRALTAAMAISAIGVCAVNIIVSPSIYVAMARERLFFASFARLHPRTGAPVLALLLQCALTLGYLQWSFVSAQSPPADAAPGSSGELRMTLSLLTESVVFAEWIFHGLVAFGLLWLRYRRRDVERPFRMPLWPLPALVYLGAAVFIVAGNLSAASQRQTLVGLAVVASGIAIYWPWRMLFRHARPSS